jgi:dTDP-4-dehydrorhamnose 3,5-epimerase-like enzyme
MQSKIVNLPKIEDPRGSLSVIEEMNQVPFNIQRVYWIYDVPGGQVRGGHAFKEQQEFIVALSGSFDVLVDDGKEKKKYSLNRSYHGLYIPYGIWRQMENFSTNSLALVLSSTQFSDSDYIRNYDDFVIYSGRHKLVSDKPAKHTPQRLNVVSAINSSVFDCTLIDLDINHRDKGNISVFENWKTLPFEIKRVYYLYDIPGGESRGGHAHRHLQQLIIAASGSFDVILADGNVRRTVHLNRSYHCLHVVPGIWREIVNFSSGSICLVIASAVYSEDDYLRNYDKFKSYKNDTSII